MFNKIFFIGFNYIISYVIVKYLMNCIIKVYLFSFVNTQKCGFILRAATSFCKKTYFDF